MPDSADLVRRAMALRGAAPAEWEEFVLSMRHYAAAINTDMLKCDLAMLPRAQGMAILAHELATVLNEAPKIYNKMQELQHGRRQAEWRG
jgi:hypothetical protein